MLFKRLRSMSLKTRSILASVIIVSISSFLFALALISIKNQLEEVTFGDMVRDQLQVILQSGDIGDIDTHITLLRDWEFYRQADAAALPEAIRSLEPGSHHSVRANDRYYQVEVENHEGERVYLTYDITEWEDQEHAVLLLLGYGMAAVLLIAIFLAWLATRTSLRPLDALTQRLSTIQPDDRHVQIAAEFESNEVGAIAREFDRYLDKLDEFVEREKFFSAAASHELRTPLSIIIGAVDVLEARQTDAGSEKTLRRIRRACTEMLAFIEATLFLSREDYQFSETHNGTDVPEIIRECIEENAAAISNQQIEIEYDPKESLALDHPPSVIKMVIGNILKNAVEHTRNSKIVIHHDDRTLTITDFGEGIGKEQLDRVFERSYSTKAGGTGLGLTLVKKICERLGWEIEISSQLGEQTSITLTFN